MLILVFEYKFHKFTPKSTGYKNDYLVSCPVVADIYGKITERSKLYSTPKGHKPLTAAELTRRAPLVIQPYVAVIGKNSQKYYIYNAKLNVTKVYKTTVNSSLITVNGYG